MHGTLIVPERAAGPCRTAPARAAAALLLCACMLLLAACATAPRDGARTESAAALHERSREALSAGEPARAVEALRRLDVLYPDDPLAVTARMEIVFAYHQAGDTAATIAAAERFIRLYPEHPNLDYLYYLRGLARFNEAMADLGPAAPEQGEPRTVRPPSAELALQYLGELLGRFPDSRYSEDARKRVTHLRRQLAEIELNAAQQALNQGQYANAGLRARALIDNYPESGLAMEAAVIVNMAHRMLNLEGVARPPLQDPAPAGAPEQESAVRTPPPAQPAAETPRDAAWIAQQDPSSYTIQLFSTSSEQALLAFAQRHRIRDAAYFRSGSAERTWYSLIHGVFATVEDARAAAERLPAALRGEKPWIRRMGDLQMLLR